MRLEFIEEILIPRIGHNPILMMDIISEIEYKILGKRDNIEDKNTEEIRVQFKRVCMEAIL